MSFLVVKSTLWRQQHTASPVLYALLRHVCGRMNDVAWTWSYYFTAGMYPPGDLVCGYSSFVGARGLPPCKLIRRPFLLAPACGSLRLPLDGAPQRRPPHLVGPCQWLGRGLLLASDSETTCVVGWPPVHCRTGRLAMMASKQDPNASRCPWRWSTQPLDPNGWHPAGKSWLCVLLTCMRIKGQTGGTKERLAQCNDLACICLLWRVVSLLGWDGETYCTN